MKSKFRFNFIIIAAILVISGIESKAQDWPRWRGVNNDGISKETGLNLNWSEKKPPLAWTFREAGSGYAAPTIVGTTLYCQGAADGNDFAFALDTQTGKLKWKQILGSESVLERGNGGRGSITVDREKLYLIRGTGQIHCLSATDGKIIWQKDFKADFNGKMMSHWGYSESPLIDLNFVICTPGGEDGTMIALNKNTGAVVWRCTEWADNSGYSSPIVAEIDGVRQYIQLAAKNVAGVSAKDGKLLWSSPVEGGRVSATIPTPIFFNNNMVYITNGYGVGCILLKITGTGEKFNAEVVYANKNMENQHGGVVLVNGHIYGFVDKPTLHWACQNIKTGEIVWSEKNKDVTKGAVLCVDDRLILQNEQNGLITVIAASPEGYKEFCKMEFPERSTIQTQDNAVWTHPVVANGKLYLRDHDLLFCYDLKK